MFIISGKRNGRTRHNINSSSSLNVCYFNARSVCNKLNELNDMLNGVYLQSSYDVICVNETWLNSDVNYAEICGASPYNVVRKDRGSVGGGVAIFVKNTFRYNEVFVPNKYDDVEVCAVDIITDDRRKLRYICVYRPPNARNDLTVHMSDCLTNLSSVTHDVCITGDLNCDGMHWDHELGVGNSVIALFKQWSMTCSLNQLCNSPTRDSKLLDYIFATAGMEISDVTYRGPFSTSDHSIIDFKCYVSHDSDRPLNSFLFDFKSADYKGLNEYLSNIQWDVLFDSSATVNDMWLNFLSVVNYGIVSFVPKTKIIKSKKKYYP